jgi:hypothetical protein
MIQQPCKDVGMAEFIPGQPQSAEHVEILGNRDLALFPERVNLFKFLEETPVLLEKFRRGRRRHQRRFKLANQRVEFSNRKRTSFSAVA